MQKIYCLERTKNKQTFFCNKMHHTVGIDKRAVLIVRVKCDEIIGKASVQIMNDQKINYKTTSSANCEHIRPVLLPKK